MKNALIRLISGLILLSFIGIKQDPEFYEPSIFLKYRPHYKMVFWSPTGESDWTMEDLSPEKQREERLYNEFVGNYWDHEITGTIAVFACPFIGFLIGTGLLFPFLRRRKTESLKTFGLAFLWSAGLFLLMALGYWNLKAESWAWFLGYGFLLMTGFWLIYRKVRRAV